MKRCLLLIVVITALMFGSVNFLFAQTEKTPQAAETVEVAANEKLAVVWTSGDREVALKMVFMYVSNAPRFNWWKDITLVVWGPSAKLLAEDQELQDYLKKMIDSGIVIKACKACSDQLGVSEKLTELGVNVKYMGGELTDYIKEGRHVLTF